MCGRFGCDAPGTDVSSGGIVYCKFHAAEVDRQHHPMLGKDWRVVGHVPTMNDRGCVYWDPVVIGLVTFDGRPVARTEPRRLYGSDSGTELVKHSEVELLELPFAECSEPCTWAAGGAYWTAPDGFREYVPFAFGSAPNRVILDRHAVRAVAGALDLLWREQ